LSTMNFIKIQKRVIQN